MKVKVIRDECQCTFIIEDPYDQYADAEIKLSPEKLKRYRQLQKEYWKMQDVLRKKFNKSSGE